VTGRTRRKVRAYSGHGQGGGGGVRSVAPDEWLLKVSRQTWTSRAAAVLRPARGHETGERCSGRAAAKHQALWPHDCHTDKCRTSERGQVTPAVAVVRAQSSRFETAGGNIVIAPLVSDRQQGGGPFHGSMAFS